MGKGVSIASIGTLLKANGFHIAIQKIDPYINIDPGTMSPYQHGEVYITEDGSETDLDIGYYERFTDSTLTRDNSVTTGQIYQKVIKREREGYYLGRTVQIIPHITNEIKSRIEKLAINDPKLDFILVEIGGTVGDIESIPFLEAIRQFRLEKGMEQTVYIHVTLLPVISDDNELKTKPTQHSVKELLRAGIQPDFLICRSKRKIPHNIKEKIALFCNVQSKRVISAYDIWNTIYEIPIIFKKENLDQEILNFFNIKKEEKLFPKNENSMLFFDKWCSNLNVFRNPKSRVCIAVVGKYVSVLDSYRSIYEALVHGGFSTECYVEVIRISSEEIKNTTMLEEKLENIHGILIPGGFGERGILGKILTIQFARENNIPLLGICLGMQCIIIEFARNVLLWHNANSTEIDKYTEYPVIYMMEDQMNIEKKGGTMRLGTYECVLKQESLLSYAYQKNIVHERHRHRYEFNNRYKKEFENNGMVFSGTNSQNNLVEAVELDTKIHSWFVGIQFHPEMKSTPLNPHPIFENFIQNALEYKNNSISKNVFAQKL